MTHSLCIFNFNKLSVEMCVLKLIKIALKKKASSIAVRFDPKRLKIQVVDNGIGFTRNELLSFFSRKKKNFINNTTIFDKILINSKAIIITSRSVFSEYTYVKVASVSQQSNVFQGIHRPSKGTTVSIYGFNVSKWKSETNKNCSISYTIAAIAFTELNVSFSLRNDEQQKIVLNIGKFHSPWEILKYFKNIEVKSIDTFSHSPSQSLQQKMKNDKNDNDFFLFNVQAFNNQVKQIKNDTCNALSEWDDWSYKNKSIIENDNINGDINNQVSFGTNIINMSDYNFINLSQLSVWSDWSYHPTISDIKVNHEQNLVRDPHYKFLPISIYKILPYKHCNLLNNQNLILTQDSSFNDNNSKLNYTIKETAKYFKNFANIRICNIKRKLNECRISENTINSLQILKQVNNEFIAAVTNENGKKLLIMIDQHAVHERIRYEWLIETYREKNSYKYLSVKLNKELWISDINENLLKLIVLHKEILTRVGINIKSIADSNTCVIDAVPKCFIRQVKSYNQEKNFYRLIKNVKQLLLEIANGLAISKNILPPILPITIHNVIASEACHEAIRFGDPLSVKECTFLVQALQDTKAPTRCAHGRPSIIPLIDLSDLGKRKAYKNVGTIY